MAVACGVAVAGVSLDGRASGADAELDDPLRSGGPDLVWDVSRTGTRGGVRLTWEEETGWAYAKLGPSVSDVFLEAPVTSASAGRTTSSRAPPTCRTEHPRDGGEDGP